MCSAPDRARRGLSQRQNRPDQQIGLGAVRALPGLPLGTGVSCPVDAAVQQVEDPFGLVPGEAAFDVGEVGRLPPPLGVREQIPGPDLTMEVASDPPGAVFSQ